MTKSEARAHYLAWLRANHPFVYNQMLTAVTNTDTTGLGSAAAPSVADMLTATGLPFSSTDSFVNAFAYGPAGARYARGSGLGSMGQDPLVDQIVTPLDTTGVDTGIDVSLPPDFTLPNVTGPPNATFAADSTTGFDSVIRSIQAIATEYITTQAQANLLSINTARARQGLPPLNQYGQPVTAYQLAGIDKMLAGFTGGLSLPVLLLLGLGAFLLLRKA